MPVTIGEFEVVSPPAEPPPAAQPASAAPAAVAIDPLELQRQLQALREQALRTWSH